MSRRPVFSYRRSRASRSRDRTLTRPTRNGSPGCLAVVSTSCGDEEPSGRPGATSTTPIAQSSVADLYDVSALVEKVSTGIVSVIQEQVRVDLSGDSEEVPAGSGTGIVVEGGRVITNAHVVIGADSVFVVAEDGRRRTTEVAAASPSRDLALLTVDDTQGLEPLPFDQEGAQVGSAVVAAGQAQNVGFAIPISAVRAFIDQFDRGVGEPFLGVALADNSALIAQRLGIDITTGAVVLEVVPGSPADEAGLTQGDVITRVGDETIETAGQLTQAVFGKETGDIVELEVVSASGTTTIEVTIGERSLER